MPERASKASPKICHGKVKLSLSFLDFLKGCFWVLDESLEVKGQNAFKRRYGTLPRLVSLVRCPKRLPRRCKLVANSSGSAQSLLTLP
jgi:hypothetical protein